jgi:hypothetical protein
MQSGARYRRRVKSALESETRFHRSVVESADDEVLAIVTLRAPRQFLIFIGKTLHHLGPRNVRTNFGQDPQRTCNSDAVRD